MSRTRRRWSSASRTAPWTCGTQRSEYGSWTLCAEPWCARWSPLSRSRWRSSAGDRDLARVRPGQLVRGGERDVGPEQRLDRHRRRDARGADQPVGVGEEERAERAHQLRAVEQREALLRPRASSGSRPASRSATSAGTTLAADLDLAAPDERQREVGERREVARTRRRCPAPGTTGWMPVLEEGAAAGRRGAAGSPLWPERQRVRPQQEHRPDDLARERPARRPPRGSSGGSPGARRVLGRDERRREVAEAGRHAVDDLARGDEGVDDVARLLHPLARVDVERGRGPCRATASTSAIVRSAPVRTTGRRRAAIPAAVGTKWASVTAARIVGYPRRRPPRPRPRTSPR